ncbi:MAG: hypothetical protein EPO26_17600 [Chloroflexota bacterium]|nr:MAG: hypothetical protein EPO26_17600 [Chloroflexota bacterium]
MTETARHVRVQIEQLTAEAFAPFGVIVDESRRLLHCDPGQYTARVMTLEPIKPTIRRINRHPDHIQLFVPLNGRPFYLVVAPATMSAAGFDPAKVRVFLNDGTRAFTFGVDVWHIAPRAIGGEETTVINVQGSRQFECQEDLDFGATTGVAVEVAL